jgi:NACalpha-BTF3-like transcription factor
MSDDKSFKERVEEIRQRRERAKDQVQSEQPSSGGASGIDEEALEQGLSTSQMGVDTRKIQVQRVEIWTEESERLIFDDANVQHVTVGGAESYQIFGELTREPLPESASREPTEAEASDTRIFDESESTSTPNDRTVEIDFCPQCGSNLGSFDDPQYCSSCGHQF